MEYRPIGTSNYRNTEGGAVYTTEPKGKPQENKKPVRNFVIFVCVVLVIAVVGGLVAYGYSSDYPSDDYIGLVEIQGSIMESEDSDGLFSSGGGYNHQQILDALEDMKNDDYNKGLILSVNTPGGSVYLADELYLKIKEYKETTKRPVFVYMKQLDCSAGYYISVLGDEIWANRNTMTGSIGVTLGEMFDISELMEKYGVKVNNINSGKNKAMGSMYQPMTEEQRAIFQSMVDEAYERFIDVVTEGRNMDKDKVRALADGRVMTAGQALSNGLIDKIGTYDEFMDYVQSQKGLGEAEVVPVNPEEESTLADLLGKINFKSLRSESDLAVIERFTEKKWNVEPLYMAPGF